MNIRDVMCVHGHTFVPRYGYVTADQRISGPNKCSSATAVPHKRSAMNRLLVDGNALQGRRRGRHRVTKGARHNRSRRGPRAVSDWAHSNGTRATLGSSSMSEVDGFPTAEGPLQHSRPLSSSASSLEHAGGRALAAAAVVVPTPVAPPTSAGGRFWLPAWARQLAGGLVWPAAAAVPLVLTHNDLYRRVFPESWLKPGPESAAGRRPLLGLCLGPTTHRQLPAHSARLRQANVGARNI